MIVARKADALSFSCLRFFTAAPRRISRDAERTITGGFFDGKTSAEERRAYLLGVLRAAEPAAAAAGAPDAAGLNALLARNEAELAQFTALDARLDAQERAAWLAAGTAGYEPFVLMVHVECRAQMPYLQHSGTENMHGIIRLSFLAHTVNMNPMPTVGWHAKAGMTPRTNAWPLRPRSPPWWMPRALPLRRRRRQTPARSAAASACVLAMLVLQLGQARMHRAMRCRPWHQSSLRRPQGCSNTVLLLRHMLQERPPGQAAMQGALQRMVRQPLSPGKPQQFPKLALLLRHILQALQPWRVRMHKAALCRARQLSPRRPLHRPQEVLQPRHMRPS